MIIIESIAKSNNNSVFITFLKIQLQGTVTASQIFCLIVTIYQVQ